MFVFYVFVFFCFLLVVCDVMPYNVHYGQLVLHACVKSQWSNKMDVKLISDLSDK